MSVDILAFGAHPDDIEIGVGGILAKHSRAGKSIVLCDLTEAELSTNGTVENRYLEAQAAANILGVKERVNLKLPDRGLRVCDEQIDEITRVIRQYRPTIVLAPYPKDRHPDHVKCGQLVQEAVFNAGLVNKQIGDLPAHRIKQLYYYLIHEIHPIEIVVDISEVYDDKIKALRAYQSQFMKDNDGIDTPINDSYFFDRIRGRDLFIGHQIGCNYGEVLISSAPIQLSTLV